MKDFIDHLNRLKKTRLKEIETQLKASNQEALSELTNQIEATKEELKKKKKLLVDQAVSRQKYQLETELKFEQAKKQLELLEDVWSKTTDKYFADPANLEKWLETGIELLPDAKGKLRSGASLQTLQKKVKAEQISLEHDQNLDKTPGFIFESNDQVIDYTLPSYLADLLEREKSNIFNQVKSKTKKS